MKAPEHSPLAYDNFAILQFALCNMWCLKVHQFPHQCNRTILFRSHQIQCKIGKMLAGQIDVSGRLLQNAAAAFGRIAIDLNPIAIHQVHVQRGLMRFRIR